MSGWSSLGVLFVLATTGCGNSCPRTNTANDAKTESTTPESSSEPSASNGSSESSESTDSASSESGSAGSTSSSEPAAKPSDDATPDPPFPEDASVSQAMAAIPRGTQRSNIDQDALGAPLQNVSLYDPCKPGGQHFKLRVAVWNGHAVGIDVTTPNKKLGECVKKQLRTVTWPDKVRSLNTVEFSL